MDIQQYFQQAIEKNAADLHLVGGSITALRIGEELIRIDNKPSDPKELQEAIFGILSEGQKKRFVEQKELDFGYTTLEHRFRVNVHLQEGKIGLTARLIPNDVPTPEELHFSETLYNLTHLRDGLVLVVGPSGSGKSSTLAAMINIINAERKSHIITIEDPIEFLFKEQQSVIEQRELGLDTHSFAAALRSSLRQDPNVIMVGEMRDVDTVSAAITAAETGHLIISTLHTSTAPETIQRIVDFYPADRREQVLGQLASNLRAIIAQDLVPTKDGKRIVAREILINNNAVSNLIRRNQMSQIMSAIQTGAGDGMVPMNKAIDNLVTEGLIDQETANNRKRDLETKSAYY